MGVDAAGDKISLSNVIDLSSRGISLGTIGSIVFFLLLLYTLLRASLWHREKPQPSGR